MTLFIFHLALLIFGLSFIVFGLKLLFKKGYADKRYNTSRDPLMSPKDAHMVAKYGNGIFCIVFGAIFVGYTIFYFLN